jgi:hypothetical protein
MKKSIALIFAASILVLAGCCTTHHTASWEYQTRHDLSDTELNKLGEQGWKVVGFTKDETQGPNHCDYVLERRKK